MNGFPSTLAGSGVTGVLLNWARPANLAQIARGLLAIPAVDEVLIWDNSGVLPVGPWGRQEVRVIQSPRNARTWGRSEAARIARNDLILTCDDDNEPRNWDAILAAFCRDPLRIVAAMPPGHAKLHRSLVWGDAQEVLLGWGAAFDRRWIDEAFRPWVSVHGVDGLLESKADRVFSIGLRRRHEIIPADFELLPGATGDEAIYREPGHRARVTEARKAMLELIGYDPRTRSA